MPKQLRKQSAPESDPKRVARIPGYTAERQTAEELGLCLRTLRKWRAEGVGPPYVKIGKQVIYPDLSRAEWLRRRVVEPTREQAATPYSGKSELRDSAA